MSLIVSFYKKKTKYKSLKHADYFDVNHYFRNKYLFFERNFVNNCSMNDCTLK